MAVDFDPFSREYFDDPLPTYARLREEAPCFHSETYDFYTFSRFDDVVAAHRDTDRFTSTHGLTYEQLTDENFDNEAYRSLIMMDPPEHTRYRKLVSRSFTPRSMARYEDTIRSLMAEYLDPLMDRDAFDLVGEFSGPFPVEVICAILGIPKENRQRIRHLADITLTREEGQATGGEAAREAQIEQGMLFYEFAVHKRANPGDDMGTALIDARVETDDGELKALDDAEIAGFCSLLGAAGSETVTKAVANAAVLFHRNPDQWQKVKDDPSKIPAAVEEVLRYWAPSQYQGRMSTVESEWYGVSVPAGKPVFLLTGAANHDEREFDDPDMFQIEREQRLAISLGHGIHTCLGAALARMETAVAIDEIRMRWPDFAVDEAGCERVQMSNVAGYSKVPVRV